MQERAWIWRRDSEVPGLRKPRPSSIVGSARQRAMEPIVPNIPTTWHDLPPDCARRVGPIPPRKHFLAASSRCRTPPAYLVQPFSLQWFHAAERLRYGGPGRWIPRVLEFGKHPGETLLGLGKNLGTDLAQYGRCGSKVVVCNPVQDDLQLIRRNFGLRGLAVRAYHATWQHLPLDNASVDVVHLDGVLHDCDDPHAIVNEIYRVLKPGGKVVAVVPARPRRWQAWHNPRPLFPGLGSRESNAASSKAPIHRTPPPSPSTWAAAKSGGATAAPTPLARTPFRPLLDPQSLQTRPRRRRPPPRRRVTVSCLLNLASACASFTMPFRTGPRPLRSRSGGIGRRARLRAWFPSRECRFKSCLRH